MKAAHARAHCRAQRQREALVVVTRLADGAQCLVDAAGLQRRLGAGAEQVAEARRCSPAGAARRWQAPTCFARAYVPSPRLLIVGAVHIAQALAPMAATAGFEVIVIDPRGAFASPERFPGVR
jgi:xanthine dehydrogenase accessory factor